MEALGLLSHERIKAELERRALVRIHEEEGKEIPEVLRYSSVYFVYKKAKEEEEESPEGGRF